MLPDRAVLQMCRNENCTCLQHQILDYLEKNLNVLAKLALAKLENVCEMIDGSGLTLLHYSAKNGNAEMTQHLIDQGCKVDAQDGSGATPLMLAVKAKDVKTTEVLLKNSADIYVTDINGMSTLELVFRMRLYSTSSTPLNQNSHVILGIFFDKVNTDFLEGKLTHFLLNANDLVKLSVVVFGKAEVVEFMLKNGYSIDYREPQWDFTALHCSINYGRFENAKILIEHGANVNTIDKFNRSLLDDYVSNFEDVDENSEVLKKFLKYSTTLSFRHKQSNYTVMEVLLSFGKKKTIRTILLSGLNLDDYFRDGNFLLNLIVSNKNAEAGVLDLLDELHIKFDVNQRYADEYTALITASFYGCSEKVEFLLQHGADPNLTNIYGDSPLSHTDVNNQEIESKVVKIIEMLLLYGADAKSFYSDRPYLRGHFCLGTKIIVAHLAMLEALEPSYSADFDDIDLKPRLRVYYSLCKQQLEEMKEFEVKGTVTLFELLREGEKTIFRYARNRELLLAVSNVVNNYLSHLESYYVRVLQRNIFKGLELVKLQEKSKLVIARLTGLCSVAYYAIVYKIVSYLDHQDRCNLCEIDSIPE